MNLPAALPFESSTVAEPEQVYPYDIILYDRRFLNCCQRQAVVFLGERGVAVDLLFYRALVSSDAIMTQMVLNNAPKYSIETDYFCAADLALIGVEMAVAEAECFADIKATALSQIRQNGFALLAGDVFHFPHCPEYRLSHGEHVVVLVGYEAPDRWSIVDDNHASVLCAYKYDEPFLRSFFEGNGARKLRYPVLRAASELNAAASIEAGFGQMLSAYRDSYRFYDEIDLLLANPYSAAAVKYRALHDCFALLSGSRYCLARYLEISGRPVEAAQARTFSEAATVLKSIIVKAQITGRLKIADVVSRCQGLKQMELGLLQGLGAPQLHPTLDQ